MKITVYACCFLLALATVPRLTAGEPPRAEPSVALISKTILDVTWKQTGKEWNKARRGELLGSGDMVKTGEQSLAIIKFKDNSLVRMDELSQLVVTGRMNGPAFEKSVDIENGSVGFSIEKQEANEEFRFSSPTSVASIRGTGGRFTVADTTDTLTVLHGSVRLQNRFSDTSIDVNEGWTGVSGSKGALDIHRSTGEERRAAEAAVKTGDTLNKLELELHDDKGGTKKLKIEFKE